MSNGSRGVHVSRMIAKGDDEWLSVHAIAQYSYCPRAGLIAFENKRDEPDDEPPAFDTLPRFEIEAVEAEIRRKMQLLFRYLWAILIVAASSPVSVYFKQYWYLVLAGVAMLFITWQSLSVFMVIQELQRRRSILLDSKCVEPDPYEEKKMQPVNWFGLLNLGFQSQIPQEPLEDEDWRFRGKPWRLLMRGDLVIPVFKTRGKQESPKDTQITKCMAYCRLVSKAFKNDCPYGIVLVDNEYSGFAIPNNGRYRKAFHDSLVNLRHLVQSAGYGSNVEVGYSEHKCSKCPMGRPRLVSLNQRVVRFGAPVEPNKDSDGMHSDCGDRFEWRPPYRG